MRDSYFHMLRRCLQWSAPGSIRGAEWFYSGIGSLLVYVTIEALKEYFNYEIEFKNQLTQSIFSFFAAILIVFVLRLICSPFAMWMEDVSTLLKITRNQAKSIEIKNASLDAAKNDLARLVMRIERTAHGGYTPDKKYSTIFAVVTVYNVGRMPTVAENFRLYGLSNSKKHAGQLQHVDEKIVMQSVPDINGTVRSETYFSKDEIAEKASNPIQPGSFARGHLLAFFPSDTEKFLEIEISCQDIFENKISVTSPLKFGPDPGPTFIPSMKIQHF